MENHDNAGNTRVKLSPATGKSNMTIHTFGEVDLPRAVEDNYNDFVTYGDDNLYPMMLIDAWQQSSLHYALTNGIIQMVAGEGLNIETIDMGAQSFAGRVNRFGESLEVVVGRLAVDLYLHGYFGLRVVYNKARTKIVECYHQPAEQIRAEKANNDGEITGYYISGDWARYRNDKFKPRRIPAYNPQDRSHPEQLMFVKQYRPAQFYYSTPGYVGGMNWILLDNRIAEFHLNNIENGFFPSSIVQFFNGEPPQEEKRKIEQRFMQKFTGKKQSKIVFVYNNNQEEAVRFDTYEPANIDKRFRELTPEVSKNIMIAHRIPSPLLFGIRDGGGLGNNAEELQNASVLLNKMVVVPLQNIIIGALSNIFRVNNWDAEITIETLQPGEWIIGDPSDAEATDQVEQNFSSDGKPILPQQLKPAVLRYLEKNGESLEQLESDGWVVVAVDNDLTERGREIGFDVEKFQTLEGDPETESENDRGLYKVRYEYRGPRDDRNRDFCASVLDLRRVYRMEDITEADSLRVNPEFGNYSIWDYKGSYGCRHRWYRLIFFRRRDNRGRFLPNDGLENDRLVSPGNVPTEVVRGIPDEKATVTNDQL